MGKRAIAAARARVYPLEMFPADKQAQIRLAVESPVKPPRWLYFGVPGDFRPLGSMPSRAWYEWHWARGIDPDGHRTPVPPSVRHYVISRDGYICGLCGGEVEPDDLHLDHIQPYSKGGSNEPSNLQVTHSACNIRKGARFDGTD